MITTQDIFKIELGIWHLKEKIEKLNSKKQSLDFEINKLDIFEIELGIWHLKEKISKLELKKEKLKQEFQKQKSIGTKK